MVNDEAACFSDNKMSSHTSGTESPPDVTEIHTSWAIPAAEEWVPLSQRQATARVEAAAAAAAPTAEEWVPLSQRQAMAREKLESEAAAKKLASVVAPCELDSSGLPILPDGCLPIKHWNRWLEVNKVRKEMLGRRHNKARMAVNKVMRSLANSNAQLVYENFCKAQALVENPNASISFSTAAPAPSMMKIDCCEDSSLPAYSHSSSRDAQSVDGLSSPGDVKDPCPETEQVPDQSSRRTMTRSNSAELFSRLTAEAATAAVAAEIMENNGSGSDGDECQDFSAPTPFLRRVNSVELFSKLQGLERTC